MGFMKLPAPYATGRKRQSVKVFGCGTTRWGEAPGEPACACTAVGASSPRRREDARPAKNMQTVLSRCRGWAHVERGALLRGLHFAVIRRSDAPRSGPPAWKQTLRITDPPADKTSHLGSSCSRSPDSTRRRAKRSTWRDSMRTFLPGASPTSVASSSRWRSSCRSELW